MSGYRKDSKWNDLNEIKCLLAFKQLEEKNSPRNMHTDLSKDISKVSGLNVSSIKAKIGNYKSVAGITSQSNASLQTKSIFKKYGHLNSGQIQELLTSMDR